MVSSVAVSATDKTDRRRLSHGADPGTTAVGGASIAVPYLFLAPYLVIFALFMLVPTLAAVVISFMHWDILGTPQWVGLRSEERRVGKECSS